MFYFKELSEISNKTGGMKEAVFASALPLKLLYRVEYYIFLFVVNDYLNSISNLRANYNECHFKEVLRSNMKELEYFYAVRIKNIRF